MVEIRALAADPLTWPRGTADTPRSGNTFALCVLHIYVERCLNHLPECGMEHDVYTSAARATPHRPGTAGPMAVCSGKYGILVYGSCCWSKVTPATRCLPLPHDG